MVSKLGAIKLSQADLDKLKVKNARQSFREKKLGGSYLKEQVQMPQIRKAPRHKKNLTRSFEDGEDIII